MSQKACKIISIILQTRELIEHLKFASDMEMQGGKSKLETDSKTLLRILCETVQNTQFFCLELGMCITKGTGKIFMLMC